MKTIDTVLWTTVAVMAMVCLFLLLDQTLVPTVVLTADQWRCVEASGNDCIEWRRK